MLYLFCENYQHNASYLTCLKEHSSKSHCDRASSLRVGSQASQMRKSVFTVTNYWTTEVWGLLLRFKWTFKGEKENLTYQKKKSPHWWLLITVNISILKVKISLNTGIFIFSLLSLKVLLIKTIISVLHLIKGSFSIRMGACVSLTNV